MLILTSLHTGGRPGIYAAEDDGSAFRCVTAGYRLSAYQRLRLSPDRTRLLFHAIPPGQERGQFFVWPLGTDKLGVYREEEGPYPYDIRWLTDETLLCVRKDALWIANLVTAGRTNVDLGGAFVVLDVAPGGSRLLMVKSPPNDGSIYVGDIAREQVREIVRGEDFERTHAVCYPVAWSPDGQAVACVGGIEDEVWLIDADGGHPRKIADTDYFWREIRWSPDGGQIAYTRTLDAGGPAADVAGVFVKDLATGEESQALTLRHSETGSDRWGWTADGLGMIHAKGGPEGVSLLRANLQTGVTVELVSHAAGLADVGELVIA